MFIKRAILTSFLLFIGSLILNIFWETAFNIKLKSTNPSNIPLEMWFTTMVSTVILVGFGIIWFFKSPKIVANTKNGFLIGLIVSLTGFLLDIAVILPLNNGNKILLGYFYHWQYWTTFTLIILLSIIIGYIKKRNKY